MAIAFEICFRVYTIGRVQVNRDGMKLNRTHQPLVYYLKESNSQNTTCLEIDGIFYN
jgi:hypothetical protein